MDHISFVEICASRASRERASSVADVPGHAQLAARHHGIMGGASALDTVARRERAPLWAVRGHALLPVRVAGAVYARFILARRERSAIVFRTSRCALLLHVPSRESCKGGAGIQSI